MDAVKARHNKLLRFDCGTFLRPAFPTMSRASPRVTMRIELKKPPRKEAAPSSIE
jgi:hypothetical protein